MNALAILPPLLIYWECILHRGQAKFYLQAILATRLLYPTVFSLPQPPPCQTIIPHPTQWLPAPPTSYQLSANSKPLAHLNPQPYFKSYNYPAISPSSLYNPSAQPSPMTTSPANQLSANSKPLAHLNPQPYFKSYNYPAISPSSLYNPSAQPSPMTTSPANQLSANSKPLAHLNPQPYFKSYNYPAISPSSLYNPSAQPNVYQPFIRQLTTLWPSSTLSPCIQPYDYWPLSPQRFDCNPSPGSKPQVQPYELSALRSGQISKPWVRVKLWWIFFLSVTILIFIRSKTVKILRKLASRVR